MSSLDALVSIPTTREVPADVRRGLRALDPTAEVVYLGFGKWVVGRVRPTDDSMRIARHMLASYWRLPAAARGTKRSLQRYRFALACQQGFRPVAQYVLRDLDGRVVREFQESQWRMTHQRGDLLDEYEQAEAQDKAERREQLRDLHRANDVCRYVSTSNFGRATPSVQAGIEAPRSSARTLITKTG